MVIQKIDKAQQHKEVSNEKENKYKNINKKDS